MAKPRFIHKKYKTALLFFLLLILPLMVYVVFQQQELRQHADELSTLYLLPNADNVLPGEKLIASFILDSQNKSVNTVQFTLTYPQEKLEFEAYDSKTSAFAIENEAVNGNGFIRIERETTIPVTKEQPVIDIIFRVLKETKAQELTLSHAKATNIQTSKNEPVGTALLSTSEYTIEEKNLNGLQGLWDWLLETLGI
jgi:hypothetical protein